MPRPEAGKTNRPLFIAIHEDFDGEGWVSQLRQQGHTVNVEPMCSVYDLILSPRAARFLPGMEKFLQSFMKGARAVKYKKHDA